MEKIFIGIDPGVNTGFAIWDGVQKKFISIMTVSFWETIELLNEAKTREDIGLSKLQVVIEDVTQNKPIFQKENRKGSGIKGFGKIASNVGMNKRDCQLLMEWCEKNKIDLKRIRPTKSSFTKLEKEQFFKITKYTGQTSSHGRDAALLVFGK